MREWAKKSVVRVNDSFYGGQTTAGDKCREGWMESRVWRVARAGNGGMSVNNDLSAELSAIARHFFNPYHRFPRLCLFGT